MINDDVDLKARYLKLAKIAGVLLVLFAVVYAVLLMMSSRTLAAAYQALEDAGRPMSPEAIMPPPIADADNAALVYQAVELQLRSEALGEQNLLERGSELARQLLDGEADEEALVEWREIVSNPVTIRALDTLKNAATKSGCLYELDYEDGAATLLPHLAPNRSISRILCAAALTQAQDGEVEKAWDQLTLAVRIADALRHEPFLISQLVRLAQFGITVDAIAQVAAIGPPTVEQARELDPFLEAFEDMEAFSDALDGERLLLGEWAFNLPGEEFAALSDGGIADARALSLYAACKPLFQRDHAAYLTVMHGYSVKATTPFDANDADYAETLYMDVPKYCILTRMLAPALSAAKFKFLVIQGRARMARIGLQLVRLKSESGHYPTSLADVGGDALLDPFTQQPFVYKPSAGGYLLYSFGKNGVDDGGTNDLKKGDIVWAVGGTVEPE